MNNYYFVTLENKKLVVKHDNKTTVLAERFVEEEAQAVLDFFTAAAQRAGGFNNLTICFSSSIDFPDEHGLSREIVDPVLKRTFEL